MLCHPAGMCNPSIPPPLPHPGVCRPMGFPSLLIEEEGWRFSSFIPFFLFFVFFVAVYLALSVTCCNLTLLLSHLLSYNKPCAVILGNLIGWRRVWMDNVPELSADCICDCVSNDNQRQYTVLIVAENSCVCVPQVFV